MTSKLKAADPKTNTQGAAKASATTPLPAPSLPEPDPEKTFVLDPFFGMAKGTETGRKYHRVGNRLHIYISLVAFVFTGIAVSYALVSVLGSLRRNADLNGIAQPAQAVVIDRRITSEGRTGSVQRYYLTYQFAIQPPDQPGVVYRRETETDLKGYTRFKIGSPLLIKYLPSDPNQSTIFEADFYPIEYDFYALMTLTPIILLVITLVWAIWVSVRNIRYERFGRVIKGEIISCFGKNIAGRFTLVIEYKFPTPEKAALKGKFSREREDLRDKPLPKPGDPVAVLYVGKRTFRLL